ncbi:hypothetical protein FGO68_gene14159 [Halteria grandinella]|uniref:Uncharacterized protein n=1 Tax=Halteria grandinella TaxID=5974 RepID=A0A8J8NR85_HALGN|nr:hypothetical protein FGO68_gene14159 [Halteria grandinella]
MLMIALFLIGFSSFLTFKIYRLVKFKDLSLLFSIISLTLALFCIAVYSIVDIFFRLFVQEFEDMIEAYELLTCIEQVDRAKVMFIFCAFVFDIYKWCIFIIATNKQNVYNSDRFLQQKRHTQYVIAGVLAIIVITSVTLMGMLIAIGDQRGEVEYEKIDHFQSYFIAASFGLFLLCYLSTLLILTRQMKRTYPKFYQRERDRILLATLSIIVSITARIGFNIAGGFDSVQNALGESFLNNTWFYPMYELILELLSSIFPIASTIYSLMYMVMHKKNILERETSGINATPQQNQIRHSEISSSAKTRDSFQEMLDFEEGLEEVEETEDQKMNAFRNFKDPNAANMRLGPNLNNNSEVQEQMLNERVFMRHGKRYKNRSIMGYDQVRRASSVASEDRTVSLASQDN